MTPQTATLAEWARHCAILARDTPGKEFPEPLRTEIARGWDVVLGKSQHAP